MDLDMIGMMRSIIKLSALVLLEVPQEKSINCLLKYLMPLNFKMIST